MSIFTSKKFRNFWSKFSWQNLIKNDEMIKVSPLMPIRFKLWTSFFAQEYAGRPESLVDRNFDWKAVFWLVERLAEGHNLRDTVFLADSRRKVLKFQIVVGTKVINPKYWKKLLGKSENGLVFGRLACTSSKTEILNKIINLYLNPEFSS